ncbi:hypothetical protein Vretifemale_20803 [Volvox reticuliferus]|uniref:Uncharacterized protein n=1 Tax=Volvox reticuliferus TaxID=1737510 RepID=A0A8J4G203_9CHLO|nr:hypothetical protein Vretifemale_20803 [Volvox reticuliferus]
MPGLDQIKSDMTGKAPSRFRRNFKIATANRFDPTQPSFLCPHLDDFGAVREGGGGFILKRRYTGGHPAAQPLQGRDTVAVSRELCTAAGRRRTRERFPAGKVQSLRCRPCSS